MAKQYKLRHREVYKDVHIDIKADTTAELAEKIRIKHDQIDRQFLDADTTFDNFVDLYLRAYKLRKVSPDTYEYLETLGRKIVAGIGNIRVSKIRPLQVQEFLNSLTGYKDSYIRKIYHLTCQLFSHAYKNGLTTTDYSQILEPPKGRPTEIGRSLTDHEREVMLQVLDGHRGEIFCKLMLYCGLRPGEAMALQWKNVDFSAETITVDKSYKRSGFVGQPKSLAAYRTIPVPHHLMPLLEEHRQEPFDRVCTNNGKPYNESSRRAMWKSVKREMNIAMGCRVFNRKLVPPLPLDPDFEMYYLRHTYCTDLERAGVPINVARRLMGHSSISITSRIYTHDNDESLERARDLINGKFEKVSHKVSHKTGKNEEKRGNICYSSELKTV